MSLFKEINISKDSETVEKAKKTDLPKAKSIERPRWIPVREIKDKSKADLSDVFNSAFKSLGLTVETGSQKKSEANESTDSKDYYKHLEKGDNEKYYDKKTGKAYDSIEAWEKTQETLAKRYESTSKYYEEKAQKEYARFKNAEQNGKSDAEKWEHYRCSQEYYAKAKEYKEKAAYIREKFGSKENTPVSDSLSNIEISTNKSDVEKTAEKSDNSDTSDSPEKGKPIQNKIDGLQREAEVHNELNEKYSPEDGYKIISEAYLRDKNGNIVKDPETGKARRIDFVVVKEGKVVDSIEVTSKTADKSEQLAKESLVRDYGGNYVRDNTGNLIEMPSNVQTRVERKD